MSAQDISDDFLGMLRKQFYPDNSKGFFQEQSILLTALTYPASWLQNRGVALSEKRYREILHELVQGVKQHGDTSNIRYFAAYFLHCVQQHMQHQGTRYYDEGKAARNQVDKALHQIRIATAVWPEEPIIERLAEIHSILKGRKRRQERNPLLQSRWICSEIALHDACRNIAAPSKFWIKPFAVGRFWPVLDQTAPRPPLAL